MNILLEPDLAFGMERNDKGTWDVWILLVEGGRISRCNVKGSRAAIEWVEQSYKRWKEAA